MFSTNTMCGPCARVGFTFTNQRLPPCFFAPCTEDFHDISSSMLIRVRSYTRAISKSDASARSWKHWINGATVGLLTNTICSFVGNGYIQADESILRAGAR